MKDLSIIQQSLKGLEKSSYHLNHYFQSNSKPNKKKNKNNKLKKKLKKQMN
jgi:hypothetical protein